MEMNNSQEIHRLALELAERLGVEVGQPFSWIGESDQRYSILDDGRIKITTSASSWVRELSEFERMLLNPNRVVKREWISPESRELARGLVKIWPEGELVRLGGLELRVQGEIKAILPEGVFREVKDRMWLKDMCRVWNWSEDEMKGESEVEV